MDWWLFTFFVGAIVALFLPVTPAISYVVSFFLVSLVLFLIKKTRCASGLWFGITWLLFCAMQFSSIWHDNQLEKKEFAKQSHLVQGEIISLPNKQLEPNGDVLKDSSSNLGGQQRFNFKLSHIDGVALSRSMNVRLRWDKSPFDLYQGQFWQIRIKVKPAHGFANIGGFSYQTWLRQHHILATGYVLNHTDNQLLHESLPVRQILHTQVSALLPNHHLAPLLLALSFGDRNLISPALWQVLQATGTQHLIAISGLHLGLIASGSFFVLLLLFKLLPLPLWLSRKKMQRLMTIDHRIMAMLISCTITCYYAYLAGFSVPTIRALVMLLLYWLARYFGIKLSLSRWILLALFFIILLTPFSLFSASFWLSVYAVFIIFLVIWRFGAQLSDLSQSKRWLKSLIIIQLSLSVFLLPLTASLNYQLPISALFANLLAVPMMSFTTIPLSLIATLLLPFSDSLALAFYQLALLSLTIIWQWLTFLSEQRWAVMILSMNHILWLALSLSIIFAACFITFDKRLLFSVTGVIIVIVCEQILRTKAQPSWKVNVMDVGQGLAVVIERDHRAILYDTGAGFPSGFTLIEAVVYPYLQHQGINTLDKVIISHSDNDHSGGLSVLRGLMPINEVMTNDARFGGKQTCQPHDSFQWQGLTFSILWPINPTGNSNDDSCVIHISDGTHSVLLTGDISSKVERQLVVNFGSRDNGINQLAADVLIAPHHGSKTSSSALLMETVTPQYVVFSAGYLNQWHMPNQSVVNRYHASDIAQFNTAESGMVQVDFTNEVIEIKQYRQNFWPYWFAN